MATFVKQVAPIAWEAHQDYVVNGLRFSHVEQSLLERRLPDRVIDDVLEDVAYGITATLHENKPREDGELFVLYQKQGGGDEETDFRLKWESGEIKTGNVREMREFRDKLASLRE